MWYLGNGSKKPKKQDYMKEFGWQGEMFWRIDKINYEKKQDERKKMNYTNKKASQHFKNRSWF